ncbi:MAG: FG-GAP repeat domain-containing protein, partial [Chthoniobacterales bacterium]
MLVAAFVGGSGFGVQPKADVGAATIADNSIAAERTALVPQNGTMEAIAPHAQETQQAVADIRYQPPIPSGATVTVQAAGRGKPYLNLTDGREMQVEYVGDGSLREALQSGQARARALASADLDGNGTPDLVAGYAYDGGGIVTIQRGNPDAFAPKDDSVFVRMQQGYNPDSLLPQAETYQVPEPADFVQVGDFNHDNRKDVLVGTRGGDLFLLPGEGDGRLGLPEQVSLPGKVTALAAGEFRAADGWTDIAVGVVGADGPSLLIFDGVDGVKGEPMTLRLSAPATAVEIASLDNDPFRDVAVAAGNEVLIIHGWGGKQPVDLSSRVEHINLSHNARDLAVGFFLWNRAGSDQIAVLQDDGTVNILDQAGSDTRPFTPAEIALFRESRGNAKRENVDVESWPSWQPLAAASWTSVRQYAANSSLAAQALSQKVLMRSHLSFQETDDLMLLDDSWQKVNIVHQADRNAGVKSAAPFTDDLTTISLDVTGAPTAALALPQKLNGERSLLLLQAGSPSPIEMSLHTAATITVDRTDDPSGAALAAASVCGAAANDCSLRGAIQFANANPGSTITLPAGTYTLTTAGGGGGGCDGNTSGDLGINASTTITGAGSATTIILQNGTNPATNQDRIMCLNEAFALNFAYNFSGITISGGRDNTSFGGAGIVAGEKGNSLTLTNVVLSNNQSSGANVGGGALQILGGDLTLTNCTIGGTSAPGAFGARSNSAADLAKGNLQSTASGAVGFDPSAPQHDASTGILTVTGTTFSHNTAGNNGGALDTFTSSFNGHTAGTGSFSISTSTFSNNAATTNDGGAFINESFNGSIAT